MNKRPLSIVVSLLTICGIGYVYLANSIHAPFTIDGLSIIRESSASQFIGTNEKYTLSLINISKKTVRLDKMQLQGYGGIQIGELSINGKPVGGQLIPSDRRKTGDYWVASSRHTVDFTAQVESNTIQNPQSVLITYSYLGKQQTQTVQLPGAHR